MYTDFYQLHGLPFRLTPDPRFFFEAQPHRKALAYVTYGLCRSEGFIVITGDIGTGKTILVDHLFAHLAEQNVIAGKIVTTRIDADSLLRLIAAAFGIGHGGEKATLLMQIEAFLLKAYREGNRALLVVDEVQNLPEAALEELRMLSNYQLQEQPLLQTILVGQSQFRDTLASPTMEQLQQRVIASYHLQSLDAEETRNYIVHRLRCVGWQDDPRLSDSAFQAIHEATVGIPRRINLLCDRLLLFGFLEERHEIDGAAVEEVISDLRQENLSWRWLPHRISAQRFEPTQPRSRRAGDPDQSGE